MGLGTRVILIDGDEKLAKIPFTIFDRLEREGDARLPHYAGQRVRYALLFLAVHRRIIISITYMEYGNLVFDSTGAVDKKLKENELRLVRSPLDLLFHSDQPEYEDPYFRARYKWKPTPRLERRIRTLALAR